MIKGKNYVIDSKDFDFEFTYGKTVNNQIISTEGVKICDIKEIKRLNLKIYEK